DAFWACPLETDSREIFVFEWEDLDTGRKLQLRWTVLPQGFTESPNLFGQALENLLLAFERPNSMKPVQYVDDFLIAGESKEVRKPTIYLINFLRTQGLKVSKNKLQFTEQEVKYLGHWLSRETKKLDPERVSGLLSLPQPRNKKEIWQLLGLLGYCRQRIPEYTQKVKFLYEKLTLNILKWSSEDEKKFSQIKEALVEAPVLSLLDLNKPFLLFVNVED
ncbi:hypothetical protein N338_02615, partial [Podiceps cristatus]